jgi:predicted amidohydrolase YtcJ
MKENEPLTILNAEVQGQVVDVQLSNGIVESITLRFERSSNSLLRADTIIDADGGALIPGLHDHHTHILAFAAARSSVRCGPKSAANVDQLRAELLDHASTRKPTDWLRGVGYHESTTGPIDRFVLDALLPSQPVRIQHRSGHAWFLNTAALKAVGLDPLRAQNSLPAGIQLDAKGVPTGVLYGVDDWLGARVPRTPLDLAGAGAELASYGITGLTDATPATSLEDLTLLASAQSNNDLPQEVTIMGGLDLAPDHEPDLLRGPVKLVLADHGLPNLDELVSAFRSCRKIGRPIAIHCVTRIAVVMALAAWDEVGAVPGDRIEHGAVIPLELVTRIAELGLSVVTQPGFIADRGDDYLTDVDSHDQPHLWRCGSLIEAGIPVGGSTDAPFGPPDPWVAIATAIDRQTPSTRILGSNERLSASAALKLFLTTPDKPGGAPRRIIAGSKANLCLLDGPLTKLLAHPSSAHVRSTIIKGEPIMVRTSAPPTEG